MKLFHWAQIIIIVPLMVEASRLYLFRGVDVGWIFWAGAWTCLVFNSLCLKYPPKRRA